MTLKGLRHYLNTRGGWFFFLSSRGLLRWMDDERYIRRVYRYVLGKELNLENPRTFNEKIQWLKLYARDPSYTRLVDKYAVRDFVSERLGEGWCVPLVGGPWEHFDEIDFDALPEQFVLKCTHDSGGLVICRDKQRLDREAAKKKLERCLKRNYYWANREWPYKNVPPRILAEQYLQDGDNPNLNVYKILNFDGVPTIIQTIQNDKTSEESIDYFDVEWKLLPMKQNFPNSAHPLPRPQTLPQMLEAAEKLSAGFPLLRTDFYECNGRPWFSEITLYSDTGLGVFEPEDWDARLGELIPLPKEKKKP